MRKKETPAPAELPERLRFENRPADMDERHRWREELRAWCDENDRSILELLREHAAERESGRGQ